MSTSTENRATVSRVMALGFLLATLMAACLLLAARPAHAAPFTVDRNDDPDPTTATACTDAPDDCSLRGAIVAANAADGPDDITLPAGTYTLSRAGASEDAASTGDLDVTDKLTITGAGARATSVAGGAAPFDDRIFEIGPGVKATITGLTITGGNAGAADDGGVRNQGDLTLDGVAVKGNTADLGGGISSQGILNFTDSTVSGNSAGNVGGLVQSGGTANITNSTISGNEAAQFGGGVGAFKNVLVTIVNSTIAFNESPRLGGGILTAGDGSLVLVKNTIVAGNTLDNCDTAQVSGGIIRSQGNNISSDDSCPFTQSTDNQTTNPRLGPLADNGGPTDTRALLSGSPAIDAGTNTGCPDADQRGVERPQRSACDIGAFELRNSPPVAKNDSYKAREDTTLTRPAPGVLANDTDPDGDPLRASVVSAPRKGTLTLKADGSFAYKPKPNLSGTDSFTYRVSDGHGGSHTASVTIRIAAVNDAPTISPISPAPGASTPDRTPLIRAKAKDIDTDLAESGIKVFVDGRGVPSTRFVYDRATDVMSHTPTTALGIGNHTVKVIATDAEGKSTTRQWSFEVS